MMHYDATSDPEYHGRACRILAYWHDVSGLGRVLVRYAALERVRVVHRNQLQNRDVEYEDRMDMEAKGDGDREPREMDRVNQALDSADASGENHS